LRKDDTIIVCRRGEARRWSVYPRLNRASKRVRQQGVTNSPETVLHTLRRSSKGKLGIFSPFLAQSQEPFQGIGPPMASLPLGLLLACFLFAGKGPRHGPSPTNWPDGRGRDGGCPPPPAQIRTGGITAYGSHLGLMAERRRAPLHAHAAQRTTR